MIAEATHGQLNAEQITLLFSGSEVDADQARVSGCNMSRQYMFKSDGTFSVSAECQNPISTGLNDGNDSGKWWVAGNNLCLDFQEFEAGESVCSQVWHTSKGFTFTDYRGWNTWWFNISNPRFPSKEALLSALEERRTVYLKVTPAPKAAGNNAEDLARLRAEAERQRGEAEELRKQLEKAKRERELAVAERKTAEDMRRAAEEKARGQAEVIAPRVVVADRPDLSARNFALIIGNDDYAYLPDLKTAVADATAVTEVLTSRYAFERRNVKLLLNAGRRMILRELAQFRRRLGEDDRMLIYYAGHGEIDPASEAGFWQPIDAEVERRYTWIANDDIRRELKGLPAKHVLVVADSCFSGTLTRSKPSHAGIPKDRFFTEIDSHVSRKAISSGGTEPVADAGTGGHSVFAHYLLKALRGNERPYITSLELFQGLARAVTNNSSQKPEYGTVGGAGDEGSGDFTFILKKTGS